MVKVFRFRGCDSRHRFRSGRLVGETKLAGECFLEGGLAKAGGAPEVDGDHAFQLVHDAQAALDFADDAGLFGEGWDWESEVGKAISTKMRDVCGPICNLLK